MTPNRISRRAFHQSAAAISASWALAPGAWAAPGDARKYKYVDIHTHVGTFYWGRELKADQLVRMMDEHSIEKACVLPLVSPESTPYLQTNEGALAAAHAHPDRLIAFCAVDPRVSTTNPRRYGHVAGTKGILEIVKRYQEAGARGFGEHKVGLPFDHPQMMMVYEACNELGLPILFHLDDLRGIDTPGLPRLETVLKAFPQLPMIGHAAGFWASISGDATFEDFGRYPEVHRAIVPGGALDRLMEKYPNLYGDLSEPGGEKAVARDRKFSREFIIRNAKQLLFGTDFLMDGQEVPQFALLDSLDLPEDVCRQIYRDNARRLLRLPKD
jgi:hypothetical protein